MNSRFEWRKGIKFLEKDNRVIICNLNKHTFIKIKKEALLYLKKAKELGMKKVLSELKKEEEKKKFRELVEYLAKREYINSAPFFSFSNKSGLDKVDKREYLKSFKTAYYAASDKCNLSCKFCYANPPLETKPYKGDLSLTKKIIDKLAHINVVHLIISGGEPLLRKDIFEIIKYAKKKMRFVTLTTNGTLIGAEESKKLKEIGIDSIQISVDSPYKSIHDKLRGDGTFEKCMSAINNLKKEGFHEKQLNIAATLTKYNVEGLKRYKTFAKELGVKSGFSFFQPVGRGAFVKDEFTLSDEDLLIFHFELMKEYGGLPLEVNDHFDLSDLSISKNLVPSPRIACGMGFKTIGCKENGEIVPCHVFFSVEDLIIGNILDRNIEEKMFEFYKNIPSIDEVRGCAQCDIRYFCTNGCYGSAYFKHGSFDKKNPFCDFLYKYKSPIVWNVGEENEGKKIYETLQENIASFSTDN